jgi:PAS domain S-box-containing protein
VRAWPRRLQGQAILLVGLVLGATVFSYAWLTTRTQAAQLEEGLRADAAIMARNLAKRGAHHLLLGEFAELEAFLLNMAELPNITAIRVTEPDGTLLVDIRHPPGGPIAARPAPRSASIPPSPLRPPEIVGNALVLQESIQAGHLLGRVTLTYSLRPIAEMQAATWRRGLALGGLWAVGGALLLLGLLRPRLRAIQELAAFARSLDQRKGDTLPVRHAALEIAELGDALNAASRELQASERQLLAERERLAVTLASIGDGVVAVDPAGAVVFLNRVAESLTGWAAPAAAGRPLADVLVLLDAGTREPLAAVVEDGTRDGLILRGRGGAERCIVVTTAPMRTEHGNILGSVLVVRDVTAQVRAETDLQAAQATLIASEKLRALGQLAGGIAHDLNNKLMVILGHAELLRVTIRHPALETELTPLEVAAQQSAAVIRGILDFARQGTCVPTSPMALGPVVQAALTLTAYQWQEAASRQGAPITIQTALADCPPILGQPAEVQEALVQVLLNAAEAMPTGGTLTVSARTSGRSREWVDLTITDTGEGIPPAVQVKALEPFFTTKGVQRAGLGLAAVYGILQRHGGTVTLASTEGAGAAVTLRFQAAPASPAELVDAERAAGTRAADEPTVGVGTARAS